MSEISRNHIKGKSSSNPTHVGIVGGGIAGSTIALKLVMAGIRVSVLEQNSGLVNGPPVCHLHAGGNLYRELPEEQCITLLHQSIDTLKLFPHAVNIRPTVIAVPTHDPGEPIDLLPRLYRLQLEYQKLVEKSATNKVLGDPKEYYKVYQRNDLEKLACRTMPTDPQTSDEWMIPVAHYVDIEQLKFPLIMVQEYGLSKFRLAAMLTLSLENSAHCNMQMNAKVVGLAKNGSGWDISYKQEGLEISETLAVDYVVNACGFRTGELDDLIQVKKKRLVEFKAAFISTWKQHGGKWPEVIFHGERGTPNGMAQLTPYPDGLFQLHGMTEEITLFKGGLVASTQESSQPQLDGALLNKINIGWQPDTQKMRTEKAIAHISKFIPSFSTAVMGGKPLFGAQQIPGKDPTKRASSISFTEHKYARAEIVKASSAINCAEQLINQLKLEGIYHPLENVTQQHFIDGLEFDDVEDLAIEMAAKRDYPIALAKRYQ
ncbi:MAG: FAD-dependent oxidoreductase [Aliivibrio sp.]|uniref:NAD(P)-binding protein n=1 Tax=Aliivibrio sp. TaxID=1872443 RepID=UPI001A54ED69|nr:FAD-dependent oxidoreductase [Aliivibrio sp.]